MSNITNMDNTYLGQYGKMKHKEGYWLPLKRVDKAKHTFYSKLDPRRISAGIREHIKVYNYIKAVM